MLIELSEGMATLMLWYLQAWSAMRVGAHTEIQTRFDEALQSVVAEERRHEIFGVERP